jgi:hypothetical protein
MTELLLRHPDELLHEVDNSADAVLHRRNRFMVVSLKVRDESMRVNAEFDAIKDVPNG